VSQLENDPLLSLEDNWQAQPEHVIESGESLQELNTLVETLPERLQAPKQLTSPIRTLRHASAKSA
jgi:hypothetical protein